MGYIILYFILNSSHYEMTLLPDVTREEAIKTELIPKDAREITKEEFDKIINVQLDKKEK